MKNCNLNLPKFSLWLLIYSFLVTTNIKAQKKFTLSECINYAFEHNPLFNAATKDTSIAALGFQRVTGSYLPRVNFLMPKTSFLCSWMID